ncbi:ABC transporter substrate-binding protein [Rhodopila sp.]|uniref:ABC transporter substrate-binding protein n=1 Tax=Rhodopila sp. TaxID=2480087 RepID=UPI002B670A5A|nr:ABC transporter substrate-binding protein [Rhodopila sp.]HVZ07322.1 ABC transporter substrate-binding protein [Rhodopila sp.]
MSPTRRHLLVASAAAPLAAIVPLAATVPWRSARAQNSSLKIGVLGDQSGIYRDLSGPVAIEAVKLAITDSKAAGRDIPASVISGDHQNKPDIGAALVRQWIERDGVDCIVDVPNSAVALAVASVCKEMNKVYINSPAATADLTGSQCAPTTIHWTMDTWMLAHSTGGAMVKAGGDSWFFITADYAFGHALQRDTSNFVKEAGGKVLGNALAPLQTADFSSFLIQAQSSGAKVIGLANAGSDTVNCIKQAGEFGIAQKGVKLAGLLLFISDVHALGLQAAQGIVVSNTFYWDRDDGTRAFTKRLQPHIGGMKPGMGQAGCYAGVYHYLKAVAAMGIADAKKSGAATVAKMKSMPTDDDAFGTGRIREDGRALHPVYLYEVKKPSESKYAWDYYKLLHITPADEGFRPLNAGGCPLIHS